MTPLTREQFIAQLNYADDTIIDNKFSHHARLLLDHDAAQRETIATLETKVEELERLISVNPRCNSLVPPELQRLWESCNTLVEKAEFKFMFRYIEKLEQQLATVMGERDATIKLLRTAAIDTITNMSGVVEERVAHVMSEWKSCIDQLTQREQRIARLEEALGKLLDEQNGPPLILRKAQWEAAVLYARQTLNGEAS